MPISTRASRRLAPLLAGSLGLAALATGVTLAPAYAASPGLVISEVYGGGGNSGATYTHDFIELQNPTDAAISVDGMSVQYRSSTGTTAQVTELSGSVPANGHYLVQQAKGSGGTTALPTPDAKGTIAMSGSNGQVYLVDGTQALTTAEVPGSGDVAGSTAFVDMVGFGSSAAVYETAATPSLSNTTAAARTSPDADDNAGEFTVGAPGPQSSGGQEPEPEPFG
jgi:5'-nucleotidase